MVSSACGPPPGVARITGWGGAPITAVSGTAGAAGGGCQAGINVVDSCPSAPIIAIPGEMVAAIGAIGSAGAGAAGSSQGGAAGAGGSATAGASGTAGATGSA